MKHGNALRRGLALVLSAAMAVSTAFAVEYDVSKSKEARSDAVDENNRVQIEISLPSAEEQLESDVVFVLDKSTSTDVEDQIIAMLDDLNTQVTATNAKVNVGVVIFNKEAHSALELTELNSENMSEIEAAIKTEISSGTNTHAGLLAGKAMLDADTGVDANRKYMIFVSDGITYMYNNEPTATAWSFNQPNASGDWHGSGSWGTFASPDNWYSKYHTHDAPSNGWSDWLTDIAAKITAQGEKYEYKYDDGASTAAEKTAEDIENWDSEFAMSIDKALYLTHQVYQEVKDEGYHCYAMTASSNAEHPWAASFMDYLADGESVSFDMIKNDIIYLVDAGSSITDVMGHGTVTNEEKYDYYFDLVSIDNVIVGGEELDIFQKGNHYEFKHTSGENNGDVHSTLDYTPSDISNGKYGEFIWNLNEAVSNFAPVKLVYTVELKGTILEDSVPDGTYTGLLTNDYAILDGRPTQGDSFTDEFEKPTVSYTKGNGGGTVDPDPEPTPDPDPGDGDDEEPYDGPELTIVKVDEEGETITSPATFHIYKEQGDKVLWRMSGGRWSEDEEDAWSYTTRDGETTCYDLKPGTYYIVEVSAPAGYDLAEEPLEVEVESRDVTVEFVNSGDGVVTTPTKPVPDTGR